MKLTLSKYEKETIILTSEGDDTYKIYTFNAGLKKRLKEFAAGNLGLCRLEEEENGSVTYIVKKDRVSIRLIQPYSEERRKSISERAKAHGVYMQEGRM